MNIDIERYPKVEGKCKVAGQYFFRGEDDGFWDLVHKSADVPFSEHYEYRGPVTFGPCDPHLDLSSVDLSKYPIEGRPNRPGVWARTVNGVHSGAIGVTQEMVDTGLGVVSFIGDTWQRIGDFTPPAPRKLPPVNSTVEVHCVKIQGSEYWCTKWANRYYSLDGIHSFADSGCEPIGTKTVSLYDSSSAVATRVLAPKESVGS